MLSAESAGQAKEVLENLKKNSTAQQFSTWFQNLQVTDVSDKRVVMTVPSQFHRDWIVTYYRDVLESSVQQAVGPSREVHLKVASSAAPSGMRSSSAPRLPDVARKTVTVEPATVAPPVNLWDGSSLLSTLNFERFVTGASNQLACAAAASLASGEEADFSTLLVVGGAGLGKTHLLQAICHKALSSLQNGRVVAYVRAEQFVNDFLQAIEKGETARFRERYRAFDVVCFDDLHLLVGKEACQQELVHTLDVWQSRRARIVFAATHQGGAGLELNPQILSRLSSAFRVSLRAPEPPMRRDIVLMNAAQKGEQLPKEVADFIAEIPVSSVREIEGATTRVIASSRLTGVPVSLRSARHVLQDDALLQRPSASPERILKTVCQHFNLTPADLCSKRRHQALSFARQFSMYLLRERTELSLSEIGVVLGSRDHTTILHGIRKIDQALEEPRVREHLTHLRALLDG